MAEREQMMAVDKRPAAPPVVRQELFGGIIWLNYSLTFCCQKGEEKMLNTAFQFPFPLKVGKG